MTTDFPDEGNACGGGGGSSYPASASIANGVAASDDAPQREVIITYTRAAASIGVRSHPVANPALQPGQEAFIYTATVLPSNVNGGLITFTDGGSPISGCTPTSASTAPVTCVVTTPRP